MRTGHFGGRLTRHVCDVPMNQSQLNLIYNTLIDMLKSHTKGKYQIDHSKVVFCSVLFQFLTIRFPSLYSRAPWVSYLIYLDPCARIESDDQVSDKLVLEKFELYVLINSSV